MGLRAAVGNPDVLSLFISEGGVCGAWNHCRACAVERWQATGDVSHDVLSGDMGSTPVVAGDGPGVSNQLGVGVSVGGMVCRMGPETSKT